jgi:predicted nucleic acid-binding protein
LTNGSLEGSFAADAGTLIELVFGSQRGKWLKEQVISQTIQLVTHEIAITELGYILCRRLGLEQAQSRVSDLISSGYLEVQEISALIKETSTIKCQRKISLPDCFTLALADHMKIPALFSSRETEITKEVEKDPFNIEIKYLEDFD